MGAAKAEEVLAAVPKADDPTKPRGSLEDALKSYQDLADKYPASYLGKQAAKRVRELSDHESQVRGFYNSALFHRRQKRLRLVFGTVSFEGIHDDYRTRRRHGIRRSGVQS